MSLNTGSSFNKDKIKKKKLMKTSAFANSNNSKKNDNGKQSKFAEALKNIRASKGK